MKNKKNLLSIVIACFVLLACGCSNSNSKQVINPIESTLNITPNNAEATADLGGNKISGDMELLIYENQRFGFEFGYPDIFSTIQENEISDTIKMESADNKYTLTVTSRYDTEGSTVKTLLEQAKTNKDNIKKEYSNDTYYTLEYVPDNNSDNTITESGCILEDKIVCCVLSYPTSEKEAFEKIAQRIMQSLKNQDAKAEMPDGQ